MAAHPTDSVVCRECSRTFEARQLSGHVAKVHGLKKAEYVRKHGASVENDFFIFKRGAARSGTSSPGTITNPNATNLEEELTLGLNASEKKFYDDFSAEVFEQIDRDVVQWPVIMSLVMDLIQQKRYREMQAHTRTMDAKDATALTTAMKYLGDRIVAQMDALGISRAAKLKNKAQVRSTPFALISGYFDELERMTPEQHEALENEERKQLSAMRARIDKLYLSVAADIPAEPEEDDAALSDLEVERVIANANIQL